ncbi:hypothetical protein Prudu_010480 [Prunus dulcis]|uniref:Cystinosin homolog n=1 Tax=Prunus dulcis TaxID=3755 RepID=A0A4Y1R918_PRUDU|nr:hypothetical protein Prudu_010480 [Prunus dulcis]
MASVMGWMAFTCWSVGFYPQVILNFRRKSVVGLSFDFVVLNLTKHSSYLIYNATLYFSSAVQKQYWEKYGSGQMIPVAVNDVAFSAHAVLITAIILFQIAIYDHSSYLIYTATLYFSSAVQKQYFEKYRLGQMIPVAANDVAFSIHAVLLTAITLYQIAIYERGNQKVPKISIGIVAAMWLGSWVNFYGHIGKTLLFLVSIFFDLLFMGQHYVLYRGKRAVITPKIISKESLDPLVKSSDAPVSENV